MQGSVIDYVACTPEVFTAILILKILEKSTHNDHNKLYLRWTGRKHIAPDSVTQISNEINPDRSLSPRVERWCFLGELNESNRDEYRYRVSTDPLLHEVEKLRYDNVFPHDIAEEALRLLHGIIRDAWCGCGLRVHRTTGTRRSGERTNSANRIPIKSWFDDECEVARNEMMRAKGRKKIKTRNIQRMPTRFPNVEEQ